MRILAALLLLGLTSSPALAQDGAPAMGGAPTFATLGSPQAQGTPLAQDVSLKRWPDSDVVVTELTAGTPVVVIVEDGELVRVRHELEFGWVPKSALERATEDGAEAGAEAPAG